MSEILGPQRAGGQGLDAQQEESGNRAILALLRDPEVADQVDLVITQRDDAYEVWSARGLVRFQRLAVDGVPRFHIVEQLGVNPIADQRHDILTTCAEELAAAAAHLAAALDGRRDRGRLVVLAVHLNPLGLVACDQGDYRAAAACLSESFSYWELDGSEHWEFMAEWLAAVARLTACCGSPETAARLYGAAEALFDAIGEPLVVPPRSLYRRHVDTLRDTLGAEEFATNWAAGRALPRGHAVEESRAVLAEALVAGAGPLGDAPDEGPTLTPREREVLRLLATGRTDREIASALFVSRRTVNSHVTNIFGKLGVSSRREAAALVNHCQSPAPGAAVRSV